LEKHAGGIKKLTQFMISNMFCGFIVLLKSWQGQRGQI
jgi:hypothetical protein